MSATSEPSIASIALFIDTTVPSSARTTIPIGAESNIVRKRSSVSRSRPKVANERCERTSGASRAGTSQKFSTRSAASATPSPACTTSPASSLGDKRPPARMPTPLAARSITASSPWFTTTSVTAAASPAAAHRPSIGPGAVAAPKTFCETRCAASIAAAKLKMLKLWMNHG